ncbi:hypothetical protein [Actinomadura geliboluensis]|uniref:hypothetical protein n=1 Tax=Actinomadura geliboluensis TaxID=882440 RepID=UPI00262C901A|nr:hypothetical protein [Actinomadura geliboluensis]
MDFVLDEEVRRSYSKEEWREVAPFSLSETIVDDGRAPLRLMTLEQWIRAVVEE